MLSAAGLLLEFLRSRSRPESPRGVRLEVVSRASCPLSGYRLLHGYAVLALVRESALKQDASGDCELDLGYVLAL